MSSWINKLLFVFVVLFVNLNAFSLTTAADPDQAPIILTDAAGWKVHLDHSPKRIVVIGSAPYVPLDMLYMFPEMGRRLAGYERKVKTEEVFLPLVDPDYRNKVVLESDPGPEQIAALKPDLIVTKANIPGALCRSMQTLSIPVMHINPENPDRFLEDIKLIGKALGNENRADEIITYYTGKLTLIRGIVSHIKPDQRPRALLLEYNNRGGSIAVQVPSKDWIQTTQVETTGGNPVWLDHAQGSYGWQMAGFEQIAAWNPDKIFMVVWYQMKGPDVIRQLKADERWKKLKAVQTNEFYLFPEDIYGWDTPEPRWILGMLWMAGHMHPKQFSAIDMKQEIYLFFNKMFNLSQETVDKHIMPRVVLDVIP